VIVGEREMIERKEVDAVVVAREVGNGVGIG